MFSENIFFYLFSIFLVISTIMVILAQHPVFSLLFLWASFFFSTLLLFFIECEFIALLFIVVYVGAVAILFLFAVMMLESKLTNLSKNSTKYFPIGFIFSIFILLPLINEITANFYSLDKLNNFNIHVNWYDLIDSITDVKVYGQILYSYYVVQFLISGLILLLILIAVVYLTNVLNENKNVDQSLFKQLSRNANLF